MEKSLIRPTVFLLTIVSLFSRLMPHLPNMTPLGATALFNGAKIGRPWSYLLPLAILFVSDLIIGFHNTMPYVYLGFAITVFLGEKFLHGEHVVRKSAVVAIVSSLLFFFITNFGVWATGTMYPMTLEGLIHCYFMGLPFLRNMVAGDVAFAVGFFSLYQYAEQRQIVTKLDKTILGYLR